MFKIAAKQTSRSDRNRCPRGLPRPSPPPTLIKSFKACYPTRPWSSISIRAHLHSAPPSSPRPLGREADAQSAAGEGHLKRRSAPAGRCGRPFLGRHPSDLAARSGGAFRSFPPPSTSLASLVVTATLPYVECRATRLALTASLASSASGLGALSAPRKSHPHPPATPSWTSLGTLSPLAEAGTGKHPLAARSLREPAA